MENELWKSEKWQGVFSRTSIRVSTGVILAGGVLLVIFLFWNFPFGEVLRGWKMYREILSSIEVPVFPDRTCDIREFGAVSDGTTKNTEAIGHAIEACSRQGGGKVLIPSGKWFTGPVRLRDNINLHLEENAELLFSNDREDYLPPVFSRFQGMEYFNFSPLLVADGVTNIAVTGKGLLDGNGKKWIDWSRGKKFKNDPGRTRLLSLANEGVPPEERVFGEEDGLRPSFIQFISSKNILIEGVTIKDGPMWTVHPIYSENITIRNVNIDTEGINTDAIVIDSSRNVLIEDSMLHSGDDTIALKSGLEEDGWRVGRPTENVVIRNLRMSEGHAGIAIGSEMSGDVRRVVVRDTVVRDTDTGINIKSLPGRGGVVEDLWFHHLVLIPGEDGMKINMLYESGVQGNDDHLPTFQNFLFTSIRFINKENVLIRGLGATTLRNITFWGISSPSGAIERNDTEEIRVFPARFCIRSYCL